LHNRFPAFKPEEHMVAVAEPRAGILFPETAVQTHLDLAAEAGAILLFNDPMLDWEALRDGVQVSTATNTYRANWLVVSAGAWVGSLLADLHLPLVVERQVLLWFEPQSHPELLRPERLPIYICQYAARSFFYGFPNLGDGVKVAVHHEGQVTDPARVRREVEETDVTPVRRLLRRFLPNANGPLKSAVVCLYTNAPDGHFIFGLHPRHPRVIIVSPCSGHGFKFSPVIGESVASLIAGEIPAFDLSLFRPDRFAPGN